MRDQQLHRGHVEGLRGAQQRCRADREHVVAAAVVADVPIRRDPELQLHVRVRALLEQQLDDLEARGLIGRKPIGSAAVRQRVQVHRRVQRRAAPPVPLVDVRSLLDQVLRDVEVEVVDREEQRRDVLRVGEVDVRAGLDERAHALETAFARGEQQRREPAHRPVHPARLTRHLSRPLVLHGARVDLRPVLDQELHHRGLRLRGGPHQRGLLPPELRRVDVRAAVEQHLRSRDVAAARDDHQRGLAVRTRRLDVGTGIEQLREHRRVGDGRGLGHRRRAEIIGNRDVGALRNQPLDQRHVVVVDGVVQRRGPVRRALPHVRAFVDRGERARRVVGPGRVEQRALRVRGAGRREQRKDGREGARTRHP